MATTEERVKEIVIANLGVTEEKVVNTASLADDLGADSLTTVEFVMALEKEFNMDIPDDDAAKIRTIQEVIDYIDTHAKEATE